MIAGSKMHCKIQFTLICKRQFHGSLDIIPHSFVELCLFYSMCKTFINLKRGGRAQGIVLRNKKSCLSYSLSENIKVIVFIFIQNVLKEVLNFPLRIPEIQCKYI